MNKITVIFSLSLFTISSITCGKKEIPPYKQYLGFSYLTDIKSHNKEILSYIESIAKDNDIEYSKIINAAAYIPPMCYTKTRNSKGVAFNPCYSCHTKGKVPNFINDLDLQSHYNFPKNAKVNPWENLFQPVNTSSISDKAILEYIRTDNYKDQNNQFYLTKNLPSQWQGYKPDCYFNFDENGFDRNPDTKAFTGWRAYRYYPFLGTFWPTNGSVDDVLIRLPMPFRVTKDGNFNLEIYKTNLALIEAIVKQKSVPTETLDETISGFDLDANGKLGIATKINYKWPSIPLKYAGQAGHYQEKMEVHLAGGLFPEGTEILHSVRYIDWDTANNTISLAKRMKELRYAKKMEWRNYSELREKASYEKKELRFQIEKRLEGFHGDFEHGFENKAGWYYQGFIEDRKGNLRPQTNEETLACMGCHSNLGVLTDGTFSFIRKFEGTKPNEPDTGWGHWSQMGLKGVTDRLTVYENIGEKGEYAFYLETNQAGDEFRENQEVKNKFFLKDGTQNISQFENLKSTITTLLIPSYERTMSLNKSYKILVELQNFSKGRSPMDKFPKNVFQSVSEIEETGVEKLIQEVYQK